MRETSSISQIHAAVPTQFRSVTRRGAPRSIIFGLCELPHGVSEVFGVGYVANAAALPSSLLFLMKISKERDMKPDVGTIDRILGTSLGLGFITASVLGFIGAWGWIGLLPRATGSSGPARPTGHRA
jgi:hypothetical protein